MSGVFPSFRALLFWLRNGIRRRVFKRYPEIWAHPKEQEMLGEYLAERYSHGIVHVGLNEVKAGTAQSAADAILEELGVGLSFFCCPAFTPSFRKGEKFSLKDSVPEVGAFSKICMKKGVSRTRDPIHSLFVFGQNGAGLLKAPTEDTFATDGVYRAFSEPGSCWVNIGTSEIVSTVFHYIERMASVPYLLNDPVEGEFSEDGEHYRRIRHISYKYRMKAAWNRAKIERYLLEMECIEYMKWKSALVRVVDGHKATESLLAVLRKDSYFLIT